MFRYVIYHAKNKIEQEEPNQNDLRKKSYDDNVYNVFFFNMEKDRKR